MSVSQDLEGLFPGLERSGYRITSPHDPNYNCVAWGAGDSRTWWEPDPMRTCYWPRGVPRAYTLDAYAGAYESLGYRSCAHGEREPGREKVALYAKSSKPTHVARQLPSGLWSSKLGRDVDIEHSLAGLAGGLYGNVALFLARPGEGAPSSDAPLADS